MKKKKVVTAMSRFTIEFSEKADKEMEEAVKKLDVKSKVEVLRKALSLLNFVIKEEDNKIVVENERLNTRREIVAL